jgi:dTDP-glucose 4,6-dehydratase
MNRSILVTGACGFVGSNFVLLWLAENKADVVNLDCLTYAGNLQNLSSLNNDPRLRFFNGNICDRELVDRLFRQFQPQAVIHFAAETHVDRSHRAPHAFIQTNVTGTFQLLQSTLTYWQALDAADQRRFRFLHISTDEVYGSLDLDSLPFSESSPYRPNSPYSASKAASDHLVRAYHQTYGLPVLTINSSNIYGPQQFPEKLIPLTIINCMKGDPIPVYGDGTHRRDWLFVEDYYRAVCAVLDRGRVGEKYNIGGGTEYTTVEVVTAVSELVENHALVRCQRKSQIVFVRDRAGHDRRYTMDCRKIATELGWAPSETFADGLRKTVNWYLRNPDWVQTATSGDYRTWIETQYAPPSPGD